MALLEEINYNPAEDTMEQAFDKINAAIQSINSVLGGGIAGQSIRKIDGTDFNYELYTPATIPDITYEKFDIGAWNMDADASLPGGMSLGGMDLSKIVSVDIIIISDTGARLPLNYYAGTLGTTGGSYLLTVGVGLSLSRLAGGIFDSTNFDGLANRGFVTIGYIA